MRAVLLFGVLLAVALTVLSRPDGARAAVLTVTNLGDSGLGSIRDAINQSNASVGTTDTINFQAGLNGTITVLSNLPSITDPVIINGPGVNVITINAPCPGCWVFDIPAAATINNLTLRGASTGAIRNGGNVLADSLVIDGNLGGGGIVNFGDFTIIRSTISNNTSTTTGGGITNNPGAQFNLNRSTVSGNTAVTSGGGLFNRGMGSISNSTFSGNILTAPTLGGGNIYTGGINSSVFLGESTLADGVSSGTGGSLSHGSQAGSMTTMRNSIIAQGGSGSAGNCFSVPAGQLTSQGGNVGSDSTCPLAGAGDKPNTNPLLLALGNNGGPTRTHLLTVGSPAIDAGTAAGCPNVDQRSQPRPLDGDGNGSTICDSGAIEMPGQAVVSTGGGAAPTAVPPAPLPTAVPLIPPPPIPQQVQNPAAIQAVLGGIGNGTRNNTPVAARPAVAPQTGAIPVLRPPSTGDAGLLH